jgi:hypothetical protein
MDVTNLLKKVATLNSHINNSLVKKEIQKPLNIQKSADNMMAAKVRLARLIDSHVGHIVGLIDRGQPEKAKEYLDVIRPHGWEQNAERNIDKLYEQVVKGLAEKLGPEAFQALGL